MPFPPCQDPCAGVNVQEGGGCVLAGKGPGNGRSILGSPWHRFRETGREKQRMGFPAKACLGSVPNPAVRAGREAQASLFCTEQDEGTSGSSRGWRGGGGRVGVGGTPQPCVALWCRISRSLRTCQEGPLRAGAGMYSVNKSLQLFRLFWIDEALFLLILFFFVCKGGSRLSVAVYRNNPSLRKRVKCSYIFHFCQKREVNTLELLNI